MSTPPFWVAQPNKDDDDEEQKEEGEKEASKFPTFVLKLGLLGQFDLTYSPPMLIGAGHQWTVPTSRGHF